MALDYLAMTEEQLALINEYCKDDMRKLKRICFFVWGKRGLPKSDYDDLYSDAMKVLSESALTFNPNGNAKFDSYLLNNMRRSYKDWFRDNYLRAKRNNLEFDKKGRIKKDENGNPIIKKNISLDAPSPDDLELIEKLPSPDLVEIDALKDEVSEKTKRYLNNLSSDQRKVANLIMDGYSKDEIIIILHMELNEFNDCMQGLRSYRNISLLF